MVWVQKHCSVVQTKGGMHTCVFGQILREESSETTDDARVSSVYGEDEEEEEEEEDVEETVKVNNMVIDNELGGKEVTALPSRKKMWNGFKKGSFEPSRCLETYHVMLSTVR